MTALSHGQIGLGLRPGCANDNGTKGSCPLRHDRPDPTGRRMDQDHVPGLDRETATQEELRRHPLKHSGCSLFEADAIGHLNGAIGGGDMDLAIGPEGSAAIGRSVTDRKARNALADRINNPRALKPKNRWEGDRVEATALIDVDEV